MEQTPAPGPENSVWVNIRRAAFIIGALLLFLFAIDLMVSSLQHLGSNAVELIIQATSNPFTGLFIGLLVTAMIQSSSTTTSLVVALVASGAITIQSAIPIILGANVGTTITSTIISLGFINKKKEFRRAVSAGTYHDFFNILSVTIIFPLEYYYGFLSNASNAIAARIFTPGSEEVVNKSTPIWSGFDFIIDFMVEHIPSGFVLVLVAFALLFTSILLFRKFISDLLIANNPQTFSRFFFKSELKSFIWGLLTTAAIRSSTITTSLVVPLVAKRVVTLRRAAPFIMGANMGTTITAFIAATLNSNTSGAVSIAIAHFLVNFIGVLIFFPVPVLRNIPVSLANSLGKITLKYRLAGLVYILTMFFFLPFSLIYMNKNTWQEVTATYKLVDFESGSESFYRVYARQNINSKTREWLAYQKASLNDNIEQNPDRIYKVYQKNNIIFFNNEMIMFNKAGYCWDGETEMGKYKVCIEEVRSQFELTHDLVFDSTYIFSKTFYNDPDSMLIKIYITPLLPVILQQEVYTYDERLRRRESLISLEED